MPSATAFTRRFTATTDLPVPAPPLDDDDALGVLLTGLTHKGEDFLINDLLVVQEDEDGIALQKSDEFGLKTPGGTKGPGFEGPHDISIVARDKLRANVLLELTGLCFHKERSTRKHLTEKIRIIEITPGVVVQIGARVE